MKVHVDISRIIIIIMIHYLDTGIIMEKIQWKWGLHQMNHEGACVDIRNKLSQVHKRK